MIEVACSKSVNKAKEFGNYYLQRKIAAWTNSCVTLAVNVFNLMVYATDTKNVMTPRMNGDAVCV